MARFAGRVSIDLGTGDGRLPYILAREAPERLFIGIDANAAGLREHSGRASRSGLGNLVYVRAAIESPPLELAGVADRVTIVLPWGSLLAAVARPSVALLESVRALCQPQATLRVVLGIDSSRDRAEAARLGLPPMDGAQLKARVTADYPSAGFIVRSVRCLAPEELARWPSTWARRLAHGRARSVFRIDVRAAG